MPCIARYSTSRNSIKCLRELFGPNYVCSCLYWIPTHALWSLWALQTDKYLEPGVKRNPSSVYPKILRLLSGWRFIPVFLYLDYFEIIHHPQEIDPQIQRGFMDSSTRSSVPQRSHTNEPTSIKKYAAVIERGIGSTCICLITKNDNRGTIFLSRVGVWTYSKTSNNFKGATYMDSEEHVQ